MKSIADNAVEFQMRPSEIDLSKLIVNYCGGYSMQEYTMQCLLFESENEESKDAEKSKNDTKNPTSEEVQKGKCYAAILTSPWQLDSKTITKICKTSEFKDCPRLKLFMRHEEIINQSKE